MRWLIERFPGSGRLSPNLVRKSVQVNAPEGSNVHGLDLSFTLLDRAKIMPEHDIRCLRRLRRGGAGNPASLQRARRVTVAKRRPAP